MNAAETTARPVPPARFAFVLRDDSGFECTATASFDFGAWSAEEAAKALPELRAAYLAAGGRSLVAKVYDADGRGPSKGRVRFSSAELDAAEAERRALLPAQAAEAAKAAGFAAVRTAGRTLRLEEWGGREVTTVRFRLDAAGARLVEAAAPAPAPPFRLAAWPLLTEAEAAAEGVPAFDAYAPAVVEAVGRNNRKDAIWKALDAAEGNGPAFLPLPVGGTNPVAEALARRGLPARAA